MKKVILLSIVMLLLLVHANCDGISHLPIRAIGESSMNTAPLNYYKVYYYNTIKPSEIVATDIVNNIGVHQSYDYKGISSENFSATWIGNIDFKEETTKYIELSLNKASATLTIDGTKVLNDIYTFTKGMHNIQIDYTNNWHTIDFSLQFIDIEQVVEENLLIDEIKSMMNADTQIEYVGVYESDNDQQIIDVTVATNNKPIILFLSSYDAVHWKIGNGNQNNITAVILNCFNQGGSVSFSGNASVPVITMSNLEMVYTQYPTYTKSGHGYHFENLEFNELRTQMMTLFGKKLSGFTGAYSESRLTVPEIVMDTTNTKRVDDAFAEIEQLSNQKPLKPSTLFVEASKQGNISWGNHFKSEPIPKGKFQAYYFNTNRPSKILAKELVKNVATSYSYSNFFNIDANDFGAYYVGDFTFASDTLQNISISQSYAYSRIFVDGVAIFDDSIDACQSKDILFRKGTHRIEVEYISDWHGVDFLATFNNIPISTAKSIQEFVKNQAQKNVKVYVAALYGAKTRDMTTKIKLPTRTESGLLVLYSHKPIHWIIDTTGKVNLKGVIVSSYTSGSTVEFVGGKSYKVVRGENQDKETNSNNWSTIYNSIIEYNDLLAILKPFGLTHVDAVINGSDKEWLYIDKTKIVH